MSIITLSNDLLMKQIRAGHHALRLSTSEGGKSYVTALPSPGARLPPGMSTRGGSVTGDRDS